MERSGMKRGAAATGDRQVFCAVLPGACCGAKQIKGLAVGFLCAAKPPDHEGQK